MVTGLILGGAAVISGILGGYGYYLNKKREESGDPYLYQPKKQLVRSESQLRSVLKSQSLDNYINDAYKLGYIDPLIHKDALVAYNKFRNGDTLDDTDSKALSQLYNQLYENSGTFRENWNNTYMQLSNEDKLKWLDGASTSGLTIPGPAYLDTSFDTYQKEVAPVKLYSNKELAELYDLDFDYENILADYKKAGEAKVDYAKYVSDVAKNMTERQNASSVVSYLDAIRADKAQAISKGMTSGAQAAADVNVAREALLNKASEELKTGTARNQATANALLENSQAAINATSVYNNLAKVLGNTSASLYANDTARYGADMSANAAFYGADENLRAQRMAANNIMSAIYDNYAAQGRAAYGGVNDVDWLFKNVFLPKNGGDVVAATYDLIRGTGTQNTGYDSYVTKQGAITNAKAQ